MTTTGTATGMAARDWAFLACRILALYLFYQAIQLVLVAIVFAFLLQSGGGENAWLDRYHYFFRFLLAVAAGLVLWFGAARLAGWMVPRQAQEPAAAAARAWDVTRLLSLAVAVFGLALAIFAIPDAARLAARYLAEHRISDRDLVEIAVVATRLVLGILLVFGGRGIANVIGWARGRQAG